MHLAYSLKYVTSTCRSSAVDLYDSKGRLQQQPSGKGAPVTAKLSPQLAHILSTTADDENSNSIMQMPDLELGTDNVELGTESSDPTKLNVLPADEQKPLDQIGCVPRATAAMKQSNFSWQQCVEAIVTHRQHESLHGSDVSHCQRPSSSSGQGFVEEEVKGLQEAAAARVLYVSAVVKPRACNGSWVLKRKLIGSLYSSLFGLSATTEFGFAQQWGHLLEVIVPVCL